MCSLKPQISKNTVLLLAAIAGVAKSAEAVAYQLQEEASMCKNKEKSYLFLGSVVFMFVKSNITRKKLFL